MWSTRVLRTSIYASLMVQGLDLDCNLKSAICLWKFANEGCSFLQLWWLVLML